MTKQQVTIEEAAERLNDMFKADPKAIKELTNYHTFCNEELANHPTCEVLLKKDKYRVRMMGILNGIFGEANPRKGRSKVLVAYLNDAGNLRGFGTMKVNW